MNTVGFAFCILDPPVSPWNGEHTGWTPRMQTHPPALDLTVGPAVWSVSMNPAESASPAPLAGEVYSELGLSFSGILPESQGLWRVGSEGFCCLLLSEAGNACWGWDIIDAVRKGISIVGSHSGPGVAPWPSGDTLISSMGSPWGRAIY
jgi:hypothetical protein